MPEADCEAQNQDLQTPVFLLAMPQVQDPFFRRSVVLLLHHTQEGSFGFIVNRPTEIQLAEILEGMEIDWHGARDATAYFGGPVQSQLGTVMFSGRGSEPVPEMSGTEVCPGIRISQHLEDLGRLADEPPERFRLFLGYAGWGAGQLVEEIVRNDWITAPVDHDLVFSGRPDDTWAKALESVGVDPASLPSWTAGGDDQEVN